MPVRPNSECLVILHIISDLTTGGAELMLKRLIESHAGSPEFRHHVLSLRSTGTVGPAISALGVPVEALGLNSVLGLPACFGTLVSRIREIAPDIVQTWMYHADLIGGLAARRAGHRHIAWNVRIADIGPQMGVSRATSIVRLACARLSGRIPQRIIYVAQAARRVHERLGYERRKGIVIPNGYVLPQPVALDQRRTMRAQWGLPDEAVAIGSAGRFSLQKDQQSFVTAAGLLAGKFPQAHFVMMGRGNDPLNSELQTWINQSGYPERFHLLGERRDVATCLLSLDIFCLHSIGEGFPNVVAEAMSAGVPCVVTDVGDSALVVGDTGASVAASAPPALAAALCDLIEMPASARLVLGTRARSRIAENFSIETIRPRYEHLYRDMLRSS